ncbi:CatB-related O-acetyltransferase [Pseudomonas sp. NFIX28]|uniref:CatB-related O-acetyltransferase n=1 Tax=Pseudomonas sp. NFIX28 TaxID=1566235 RepID=UPI00089D7B17|nr:CatB-related O-acetyltransferase [Pseudomonas sp. NFIX28]SDY98328.1 transferase hexapeptide (six repeat-containing protein) [Pseudomonas sp. NFIX28]
MIEYFFSRVLKKARGKAVIDSSIPSTSKVESGSTVLGTTFGAYSFCGYDCTFIKCEVGRFCSIASKVVVGGARHPMEYVSTSPVFLSHKESIKTKFSRHEYHWQPRTVIGHDVWIGEGVYVKGGVTIGVGAVVGMGSVVTKDIPPYAIYAGNPARLIRYRFSEAVIAALLKSQWWEYSDEELRAVAPDFNYPETFLKARGLL